MTRMTKLLALATALAFTLPAMTISPFGVAPAFAKHGADDPAGDDRGGKGRGNDDGPGHTSLSVPSTLMLAKHGADDPAGDDRGGKGRGGDDPAGDDNGGHGNDDGPNHT